MRILIVHNHYQAPGGEDFVVRAEGALLADAGHQVVQYTRDNQEIAQYGLFKKAALVTKTIWAFDSARQIAALVKRETPDLVHFHNTFPLVSPAGYYACQKAGVPVVQSLHNPRLMCAAATLYRGGQVCEDCVGTKVAWPAVRHACYRSSRLQSGMVAAMIGIHRWLRTWQKQVDTYIVFTEFYRRKFIQAGLPPDKIRVKPHFLTADPGLRHGAGSYVLYIGRLAEEKGVRALLQTWRYLEDIPLRIRGDGPLLNEVEQFIRDHGRRVERLPRLTDNELADQIKGARFLIWPSEGYYETFGIVAIQAFAAGVPVVTSGLGAMAEIVGDGVTGVHFRVGDAADMASKVRWAWNRPEELQQMGKRARAEYEQKYTATRNYLALLTIYRETIETFKRKG